ncbi:MAG: hypothetical protein ACK5KT_14995 [Dysgonomonas sp.]
MEENKKLQTEIIPQKPTLATMTVIQVIEHCGRLKYPVDKVISILSSKLVEDIRTSITTPGTPEYIAYHSGIDAGDFEVDNALYTDILDGSKTSVDSQKALTDIQSKRTIGDAIRDKFFPED